MPGGRLGGVNCGDNMRPDQSRNSQRMTGSWIAQGGPYSTVAEDLAGRAITLLAIGGLGVPSRLAKHRRRRGSCEFKSNFRQKMVVEHQN